MQCACVLTREEENECALHVHVYVRISVCLGVCGYVEDRDSE